MDCLTLGDGARSYGDILNLQESMVQARLDGKIGDTLLMLEHQHVLTKGTRTDSANIYFTDEQLQAKGINVFEINRGGDVTYHGPGQLVGYPIVQLKEFEQGIRWFIQSLEGAIIDLLRIKFGITGYTDSGKYTGVWVNDKKIAAFGLAVVHGVTMHGFAFNVNTDLSYFDLINPCGLSKGVTSIERETGQKADIRECSELLVSLIGERLGIDITEISEQYLLGRLEQ